MPAVGHVILHVILEAPDGTLWTVATSRQMHPGPLDARVDPAGSGSHRSDVVGHLLAGTDPAELVWETIPE